MRQFLFKIFIKILVNSRGTKHFAKVPYVT